MKNSENVDSKNANIEIEDVDDLNTGKRVGCLLCIAAAFSCPWRHNKEKKNNIQGSNNENINVTIGDANNVNDVPLNSYIIIPPEIRFTTLIVNDDGTTQWEIAQGPFANSGSDKYQF